ncbi:MAG: cysteine desulfurase [Gemmatimonadota bacterium]|nr:cysteine desulfurase [Gemmatimonadota bacterium]
MATPAIYLDNAATTPVLPEVRDVMLPFLDATAFGNPSSRHRFGRVARAAVERARAQVAAAIGAEPGWIYFTSGGTEADNLAVLGGALAAKAGGRPFRVAVSATEHKAVLAAAHAVDGLGGEAVTLPVDGDGLVDLGGLDEALAGGVALVAVMWVNNEVGTIQHVATLADRCAAAGAWLVCDAVQALGKVPCALADLPRAMLALSAHKIGGPKGTGALVVPDAHAVHPLIHGGGQQGGLRPGTENVAGVVGFGQAAERAGRQAHAAAAHVGALRDALEAGLTRAIADAVVHAARVPRAPHVTNIAFPGTDSEALLMHLDLAGVCCSSGSACTTGAVTPSHVLTAMGVPRDRAVASLRFSFGPQNTMAEVEQALDVVPQVVEKVRSLGAVLRR